MEYFSIRLLPGIAILKTARKKAAQNAKDPFPRSNKAGIYYVDGYSDYKEVRLLVKKIDGVLMGDEAAGVEGNRILLTLSRLATGTESFYA